MGPLARSFWTNDSGRAHDGVERAVVRLGGHGVHDLVTHVRDTVPHDHEMGVKVTSNPLMLSMVASVYELRQGVGMPSTVAALYAMALQAVALELLRVPEVAVADLVLATSLTTRCVC